MTLAASEISIVALITTFGSVVQGTVGFASGLLGVPLLVLCGFSLLDATVINFVATCVQNGTGAVQLWPHLEPAELVAPSILRAAGLPLGIFALAATGDLDPAIVRQIVGLLLLASVLLLMAARIQPRDRLPRPWGWLAFFTSGVLTGFASIGGAPLVFYVNSLTWSAAKSRGFLFFCSAALAPLMGAVLWWQFGAQVHRPALAALASMPPVLVGLWIGLKLGRRLDKARFRRLTYGLLIAVAAAAIISPLAF
jgi:hypothetical protein